MSEGTTAVAVETPDVAVEAVPAVTANEPQLNAAERRQGVKDRAQGKTVAERVNNVAQPRDEVGRFTSASNEPEAAQETAATEEVVADTAQPVAAEAPTTDRIEIPANNPLRDRGKQYFDELTPDEIRGVLNSAVRARDVEQTSIKLREEQTARLRAEAEASAFREQMLSFIAQPEIAAKYAELKAWDEGEANRWLRGVLTEVQEQVGGKVNEFTEQHAHQQQIEYVQNFERDARSFVATALSGVANDPRFNGAYSNARERYGIAIELAESRGQNVTLDLNTFINDYLVPEIDRWPEVQQWKSAQAEQERARLIEQAKEEARAEKEAQLLAEAQQIQNNRRQAPLRGIPAQANAAQQLNVNPTRNAANIRQQINERLRGAR